jgi:hypothetical protein
LGRIGGSARAIAAPATVLTALGVAGLVEVPTATATCAVALALGGLMLVGAVTVKRASNEPFKCLAERRRVRVRVRVHRVRHR